MLTELRINNFKTWKDTGNIHLAPLTIIFGANSAGKSSLGHLLLALKQTTISTDRRRPLHLGDNNSLIDLGTFKDCIFNHDVTQPLSFRLAWRLPKILEVKDPVKTNRSFKGDKIMLEVKLMADKAGQPEVTRLAFELWEQDDSILDVVYEKTDSGQYKIDSNSYKFIKTMGRQWPLGEPEKFYRISEQSRARFQNASFLSDYALATEELLAKFYYLGPLRDYPKRIYQWSGDTPEDVGQKGEYTIAAILAAQEQQRELNRGPRRYMHPFAEFLATWLKDLGIIESFLVKQVAEGRKEYEVLVKTYAKGSEVKITDVGFGVSQVLPPLVEVFYCRPGSVVWLEQPEIHLHPQVQAKLADVFISAVKASENGRSRNVQLIIESHSEHFLNRLQRRIAEGVIQPNDVAIYFCKRRDNAAELEALRLNLFGEIENWPENFFGDEMEDLTARTVAAMSRKKRENY
jgi:predicted ATPase